MFDRSSSRRFLLIAAAVAAVAVAGLAFGSYATYLASLVLVNVIAAIGLNILIGNSGQISLCHSSFMAIGAYTTALLNLHAGLPFWLSVPCGGVTAAVVGLALGFPARRLGGVYLALATLGFLQIIQIVVEEFADVTGGVRGLSVPKPMFWQGLQASGTALYLCTLAFCLVAILIAHNLLKGRVGREMNAVRQSVHAAQALGVSAGRVKLTAFGVAAGYAGIAGGLFACIVGFVDPAEFGVAAALRQLTFIVIGGMGSIGGSIAGAVVLSFLPEALRPVKEYQDLLSALILLAAMLFMPQGIVALVRRRAGNAPVGGPAAAREKTA